MNLDFICTKCGREHTWGTLYCSDFYGPPKESFYGPHTSILSHEEKDELLQGLTTKLAETRQALKRSNELLESARGQNTSLILENEKLRGRAEVVEKKLANLWGDYLERTP